MDDLQLLSFLTLHLDESFRWNVNRRLTSGELVSYNQFWAELEAEFGSGSGIGNRQNWESLALKFDGSLTLSVFREFWEKFLMLQATVSGVTEVEAYRVLMGALPLKDREKVLMEEKRILSHKKLHFDGGLAPSGRGCHVELVAWQWVLAQEGESGSFGFSGGGSH